MKLYRSTPRRLRAHALALRRLLEDPRSCRHCVLTFTSETMKNEERPWQSCNLCRAFIGLSPIYDAQGQVIPEAFKARHCPCGALGPANAACCSWLALEEGGYLPGGENPLGD